MKYFLDSAIIGEICYAVENWGIDGVTTNPRHIRTSGKPFFSVIKEIAAALKGTNLPVSAEINPHLDTVSSMADAGRRIASLSENFVIKVPCTEQGLIAARKLTAEGIRCNVTLVFTPSQAIAAARTGASFVSPFSSWKEANGEDGVEYIKTIKNIYGNYGYKSQIIAAAIRDGAKITAFAQAGVDVVTCAFDVYKDSFYSPYTDFGIKFFSDAWDATEEGTIEDM